jgi:hypothetical protein
VQSNRNIHRYAWIVIGGILVYTGVRHLMTQKLYGKVNLGDSPIMEGWSVTGLGLIEIALGGYLIWRWLNR